MSLISPFSSELEAQKADIASALSVFPKVLIPHLRFAPPTPKPAHDVRDIEALASWAYYGHQTMPLSRENFAEIASVKNFSYRLSESIRALSGIRRSATEQAELEQHEAMLQTIQNGIGNQKRIELLARFNGYANFNEYLAILERTNAFARERGAFSFVTMAKSRSYFLHRFPSEERAVLFGARQAEYEKVLADMAPYWQDAALLTLRGGFPDVVIEPMDGLLVIHQKLDSTTVLSNAIGSSYQEKATRHFTDRATLPGDVAAFDRKLKQRSAELFSGTPDTSREP